MWPDGGTHYGAYPQSLRVYIDPAVPAQPVMAGAAMWAEFIGARQVETPEQANAWVSADNGTGCGEVFGVTSIGSRRISLHMSCWPNAAVEHDWDYVMTRWVAAHEFGHVLGVPHVNTAPAVMNAWTDPSDVEAGPMLTDADRAEFRLLYGP